jgi:pimeloyl-ACP methyl ester carboxylesterase
MIAALLSIALVGALAPPPASTVPLSNSADLTVNDRYAPGDSFAWSFSLADQPIGYHVFRYEGPVGQHDSGEHRFLQWTSIQSTPGLPVKTLMLGELITDAQGRALRHVLEVSLGGSYSRVDVAFEDGQANVTVLQGAGSNESTLDVSLPVWSQANNMLGGFDLLLSLNPVAEEQMLRFNMFSSNALVAFEYSVWWADEADEQDAPGAAAILRDSLGEMLTVDADGHLLALDVPTQKLSITRTDELPPLFELTPPETATPNDAVDSVDVAILHGDVSLAGTISRLKGKPGRLPAVLFLSGSGPQDRNGFSSGIDIGTHEILDALVERSFVVLRIDDRGVGLSTGPTDDMALSDLVDDAVACVDFLAAYEGVDPGKIAVIGHSEGGTTGPMVALKRSSNVAAVVLMASMARPLTDIMLDQNELALTQAGIVGAEHAEAMGIIRARFEQLASDEAVSAGDLEHEFLPLLKNRRWFQQHARHDPLGTLARVRCPVLVIHGELDFQVSPEKDARALAAHLDEVAHADHKLVLLPRLDHLFKRVEGELSTLADYVTDRRVDAEFIKTLCDWLAERLLPAE